MLQGGGFLKYHLLLLKIYGVTADVLGDSLPSE